MTTRIDKRNDLMAALKIRLKRSPAKLDRAAVTRLLDIVDEIDRADTTAEDRSDAEAVREESRARVRGANPSRRPRVPGLLGIQAVPTAIVVGGHRHNAAARPKGRVECPGFDSLIKQIMFDDAPHVELTTGSMSESSGSFGGSAKAGTQGSASAGTTAYAKARVLEVRIEKADLETHLGAVSVSAQYVFEAAQGGLLLTADTNDAGDGTWPALGTTQDTAYTQTQRFEHDPGEKVLYAYMILHQSAPGKDHGVLAPALLVSCGATDTTIGNRVRREEWDVDISGSAKSGSAVSVTVNLVTRASPALLRFAMAVANQDGAEYTPQDLDDAMLT